MKYAVLFFLLLPFTPYAQKVEILLIGVSHNYSKYPEQDFSGIHSKIRNFKPTAFLGEFLSKADEENLADYWCKSANLKRLETLRKNRDIPVAQLESTIQHLSTESSKKPNDYQLKADLAHAYYLNQDVSNAHFQYWQVYQHLQQTPNPALEEYVRQLLSPHTDTTGRSMTRLQTSEYAVIAFPMMLELKIAELLPMDHQDYDLNWSAAAVAFYNKFEPLRKDSLAPGATPLKSMLAKRDQGFAKNATVEKSSNHVTEWMNTDEASAIFASGDFYFKEFYDLPGFPKQEMLSQLNWWLMRNEGMCRNVVERARKAGHRKVVVIAGANHKKFMMDIFRKMPGVTVRGINEFK